MMNFENKTGEVTFNIGKETVTTWVYEDDPCLDIPVACVVNLKERDGKQTIVVNQSFFMLSDEEQLSMVAHEVGHHVQNLLGISGKVDSMRGRVSEREQNAMSVRLELQADCLAGVWAKNADAARGILEAGDVEEALRAASAIGDDTLQKQAQGYAVPDSFTHGSAEQRVRWFKRGMDSGQLAACNTFQGRGGL